MPVAHSIFPRIGLVRKARRSHDCPVEFARPEDPLHRSGIDDNGWKKQPADKECWRYDGVLEQKRR
jgi:hypothetical protein